MAKKEVGIVKWFNNLRGYGFIIRKNGDYIFLHINAIITDVFKIPKKNDKVKFDIFLTNKGEVARNVEVI